MGFFTLLLLGAIFVGSNGQDVIRQNQDFRPLLQEPIRQLQEPISRRLSSQYDRVFEKQNVPSDLYLPPQQLPPQYQMQPQYSTQKSQQQQVASQQLPKSVVESSISTDKLRQSLETQEQALYAQEMMKNQELAKKSRGVTTVCVQVHSDPGHPVVCGPEITSVPNQITNYKSPSQEETVPQEKPKPAFTPVPVRPQFMRVPVVYQNYIAAREVPRQQLSLRCEPDTGINRFTTNYRLATAVPIPTEYGLSLGLNDQRTALPGGTISQYQWGAPLSRSAVDRNLMQSTDLRKQPLDQSVSQLRTSETPMMNLYSESLAKSIDDIMRASENAASPSSYMSTMPGYERSSSDMSAVKRLEESREKLRKLTLELEEVKKARAAEEAARAEEQKQQTQQQTQQISDDDRKRISSSQEPMRPAQIAEREIRQ